MGVLQRTLDELARENPEAVEEMEWPQEGNAHEDDADSTPIYRITDLMGAEAEDLFMGFHCGNTPSSCVKACSMQYQLIMNRLMEDPSKEPDITRGTLEGQLRPGDLLPPPEHCPL